MRLINFVFFFNKIVYKSNTFTNRLFYLERYFILFFNSIFPFFLNGFLLKSNKICLFLEASVLHFFLSFCKFNSVLRISSLMDIVAIDYPNRINKRFELVYSFWSKMNSFRFFVKIFFSSVYPILSVGNFFSSSFWLEREIWDMFGIKFLLNNDLRRILTDNTG